MLIAAGVFLCIIGVIGLCLLGIGIGDSEPGAFILGIFVAACGITFGVVCFVNYGDPSPPELVQRRRGDYVLVTAGAQNIELYCPSVVRAPPASPKVEASSETTDEEEKRFEEWSKAHHE